MDQLGSTDCTKELERRSLCGNYGLVHFGSCNLNEVITLLLDVLQCNDILSQVNKIVGMKLWQLMEESFLAQLVNERLFCNQRMFEVLAKELIEKEWYNQLI